MSAAVCVAVCNFFISQISHENFFVRKKFSVSLELLKKEDLRGHCDKEMHNSRMTLHALLYYKII